MSFDAYLRTRIFEPLGMKDTGVHGSGGRRRIASLRTTVRGAGKTLAAARTIRTNSIYLRPRTFFSGGGGLVSTAHDYLRFCRMLVNGGELDGVRILGRKTIELMTCNHLPQR